jgi:hypothetical protein
MQAAATIHGFSFLKERRRKNLFRYTVAVAMVRKGLREIGRGGEGRRKDKTLTKREEREVRDMT